jgi:ribonuclease HI
MKHITIYCDGSSIGNPGPGGWGVVIMINEGSTQKIMELGGYDSHTTNNRMELTAPLEALRQIPHKVSVIIKTDSQYVIKGITSWIQGWEKNGWQTKVKKEVVNRDLWEVLVHETRLRTVAWEHVRGHVGVALNERVDVIANEFARKKKTELYTGTESEYADFLKRMPKARVVASSKSSKGKAYAYVSVVAGIVATHKTWQECEARVKGKKARYKKVFSSDEEGALVAEWSNAHT